MSKREESSKQTQAALLAAARELFLERGYASVGTEEIVARAGVTRGALYHHFADKPALFEAVFEEADAEFIDLVRAAMAGVTDAFEAMSIATRVFLDTCLDADLVRLALLDAPTVLGWSRWREIELRHGLGVITDSLSAGMATGRFRVQPIEPLAHMYFGVLMELGMYLANSADQAASRVQVENVLVGILESLLSGTPKRTAPEPEPARKEFSTSPNPR